MNAHRAGRLALLTATTAFLVGVALLNSGSSNAIGGLCNGAPASHTWLDGSGQYGPGLIDGTDKDDTIIGTDGDDVIDAGAGDDIICGEAGDDDIAGGEGGDLIRAGTGDDDVDGGPGVDTVDGGPDHDTVAGGLDYDVIRGGTGDDVIIAADDEISDDIWAGPDFDVCFYTGGDDIHAECEY